MKDVFLLTKVLLKNSNKNTKKKSNFLGYAILYLYIAGVVIYMSYEAVIALEKIGQESIFLNLVCTMTLGYIFLKSITSSVNYLFFSKDIDFLLPLPIKPEKIVMAKFNCLIISEYFLCFTFLFPAMLVYGIVLGYGIIYYIVSLLVLLLFPIIPVSIISLLLCLLMRFTNIIRNKTVVQYVTVAIAMVLCIALLFITNGTTTITDEELAEGIININSVTSGISDFFININYSVEALLNYNNLVGILDLGKIITLTIVIYGIVIFIASKFYIYTVTNIITINKNKKKFLATNKKFKKKSTALSYIKKEIQVTLRTPAFFLNNCVPAILMPLIVSAPIAYTIIDESNININDMSSIILNTIQSPIGIVFSLAIIMFFFAFNYASVTAISKEGSNAVFMKYIPINLNKQVLYKIVPGICLNLIPILYFIIALKIFVPLVSMKNILCIFIISMLINIKKNYSMIIKDLKNPKLGWTSEFSVIKQNLNIVYQMISYLTEIAFVVAVGFFIQSMEFLVLILIIVYVILIARRIKFLRKNEEKLLKNIE